eukprot:1141190-Pelagomonas_calceolata.AAC.6
MPDMLQVLLAAIVTAVCAGFVFYGIQLQGAWLHGAWVTFWCVLGWQTGPEPDSDHVVCSFRGLGPSSMVLLPELPALRLVSPDAEPVRCNGRSTILR